tara:strand:- start:7 stop:342 length:336 start_codon:yes stop_codon:yes gene_type:complete
MSCIDLIAASTRSDIANPIDDAEKYKKIKVPSKVIGNPKEKRFRVGADLVITPIETFTISKRTETGNMIIVAAKNIDPAAPIPVFNRISKVGIESIFIYSYESNIVLITMR